MQPIQPQLKAADGMMAMPSAHAMYDTSICMDVDLGANRLQKCLSLSLSLVDCMGLSRQHSVHEAEQPHAVSCM